MISPASILNALAPFKVATLNISSTFPALALPDCIFAFKAQTFISSSILKLLLEAEPSVPRVTWTFLSINSWKGIIPDFNLKLEVGQCAILHPLSNIKSISSLVRCTQ